ncbi:hypothetical protein D3C80_1449020 [compost metagenome]
MPAEEVERLRLEAESLYQTASEYHLRSNLISAVGQQGAAKVRRSLNASQVIHDKGHFGVGAARLEFFSAQAVVGCG